MDWFVEVSDGVKRSTPPKMIEIGKLPDWQKQHQTSEQGLFSSVYMYPTDDPYIGGVLSNFYMDLDCEEDPDKARKETIVVVKKLIGEYEISEDNIKTAFSGMKGISITVDYEVFSAGSSANLPLIWKSIAQDLITELKLRTADVAVYERRRLWRLINSRHQKSGLYKIPLTFSELENLSIDQIKQMADNPRTPFVKVENKPAPKAERLFEQHKSKVKRWLEARKESFEKTELGILTGDPPCVQHRREIGAKIGSRNSFLFEVAVYYAHKGLKENQIVEIGYEFAKRCEQVSEIFPRPGEIESIVNSAIRGVQDGRYSVGCSSDAFEELCDRENCPFFKKTKEKDMKETCGGDLADKVFEQITNQEFLVYNKSNGITAKVKNIEGFKPIQQIPWKPVPDAQPYDDIWDEVRQYIYEHIDMPSGYDILTAWVLATWIPERWNAVPYLFFYGPAGSGKTWALEVLASISFRSFLSASTTMPVIFRACDIWHPTLFLDETEVYLARARASYSN